MRKYMQQVQTTAQKIQDGMRSAFRGVLNVVKSRDEIQKAQVSALADETLQDVELMQQFGFTSVPPANTEAVILPIGGKTTHGVVIATENGAFRVKGLKNGEVAIYDQSGSSVILRNGKVIDIECETLNIRCKSYNVQASEGASFTTPLLQTSKVLTAQGQINGNGGLAVQGGNGASFSGNVAQRSGSFTTTGDVTAGSISLKEHTHQQDGRGKPIG